MNKDTDSDCVIIGVRVPRTLCSSLDCYSKIYGLNRSCFLRLLLSWFSLGSSRSYRYKFSDFVRQYKSFRSF